MGKQVFELSNHLGNVLATITDKKLQVSTNTTSTDYFEADVQTVQDYYAFGMQMHGRKLSGVYRYGFNGKENDNEVKGEGNSQDYGMRMYDGRIGKFLSVDPLTSHYPFYTPYAFAGNKPIQYVDLDGTEETLYGLAKDGAFGRTGSKIVLGTIDGVHASLSKSWSFLSSDMWKANTWKKATSTLGTVADITIGNFDGRNDQLANTVIQPKVDDFNKEVVNGDAYSRSKYFSETGTDFLTAYVASKGLGEMQSFSSRIVETTWEIRKQSITLKAVAGYLKAKSGSTLYRLGTFGKSATGADAQFWALENPLKDPAGFAKKYNIPLENIKNADFIETATIKNGSRFITQEAGKAPGSLNIGKGIEVVTEKGGTTNNIITPLKKQ